MILYVPCPLKRQVLTVIAERSLDEPLAQGLWLLDVHTRPRSYTANQKERNWFIDQLQRFAKIHRIRISFLSGDVHCAAVGVFKTLKAAKKSEIPPHEDHRYMVNIVTSAIVNTPPYAFLLECRQPY